MYTAPSRMAANCSAPINASVSGVTAACIDTTSASVSRSSKRWLASSAKGSLAITRMPRPFEAPACRAAHGAESDEAGGAPGQLPAPEALVRDRAVAVHLALAHVAVGGHEVPGDGEQQAHGQLGHTVGVATGGSQHRDALGRRPGEVDVGRVTARGADGHEREVEHGTTALVGLADEDRGPELRRAGGELLLVVEPEGLLVDPGVDDQLAELLEGGHPGSAQRRGGEDHRTVGQGRLDSVGRAPATPPEDTDARAWVATAARSPG